MRRRRNSAFITLLFEIFRSVNFYKGRYRCCEDVVVVSVSTSTAPERTGVHQSVLDAAPVALLLKNLGVSVRCSVLNNLKAGARCDAWCYQSKKSNTGDSVFYSRRCSDELRNFRFLLT